MFTFFFTPDPVTDWDSARKSDTARFARFFHFLLDRGVYIAPSQFEAASSPPHIPKTTSASRLRRPRIFRHVEGTNERIALHEGARHQGIRA